MVCNLEFIVPPRNQGQIVEVSYAGTLDGYVIRQIYGQCDQKKSFAISRALVDDDGEYWNGSPKNKRWRKMTEKEMTKYGLSE
jgi:hypothetical protein